MWQHKEQRRQLSEKDDALGFNYDEKYPAMQCLTSWTLFFFLTFSGSKAETWFGQKAAQSGVEVTERYVHPVVTGIREESWRVLEGEGAFVGAYFGLGTKLGTWKQFSPNSHRDTRRLCIIVAIQGREIYRLEKGSD